MLQPILLVAFLAAQSPADPITGLWGSRQGAGLDLKYDGAKTVTGTIYITGGPSAPITSGSFDPATRALKLSGTATGPDGHSGTFQIQGTAEPDRLVL